MIWHKYRWGDAPFTIYAYYDGWFLYAWEFKKSFLHPGYTIFSDPRYHGFELADYWHAGCPLYPAIAGAISIVAGNIIVSMIITSCLISLIGVYYIKKIAREYMNYSDTQSYQLIAIFISFNVVAEFFYVPLPISITVTMPIINTYYFLRFYDSPTLKNGMLVSLVYTLTLFTREIIYPFTIIPLAVLILFRIRGPIQNTRLGFKRMFVALFLTTIFIPCVIYLIYLLSTGIYASILASWNFLSCEKTVTWFLYSTFNTITFNWIFVLFYFIAFFLGIVRDFRKRSPLHRGIGNEERPLVSSASGQSFLRPRLLDVTNGVWAAMVFLNRLILPGCPIEAYFLPWSFSFAVYVFKGTQMTNTPRTRECLFWIAVGANVIVLAMQIFPFYPFFDSDMSGFIPAWIREEIGWPFYP